MPWNDNNDHQSMGNKQKPDWEVKLQEKWTNFKKIFNDQFQHYRKYISFKKFRLYFLVSVPVIWICSGFYIIDQGNRGVVSRFGAYSDTTKPGPNWHFPYPIEAVSVVNVEKQRFIEIGYRSGNLRVNSASVLPEALMLTKDENIISVRLAVQYQIKDAKDYLFNVKGSEKTLKQVTESIQRGVIGRNQLDFILTEGRSQIVSEIKDEIQMALDLYGTGLRVTSVNLQDAQPPEEVQYAFEDAIRAREDKQRLINEAQAYANEIIPKARGASARLIQEAEGYEAKIVSRATGESERFDQLLVEYEKSPSITRKRLYLEAKEKLYQQNNKVLVNMEQGNNMLYLPINQLAHNNQTLQQTVSQQPVRQSQLNSTTVSRNHSQIRPSRSMK